MTWGLAYGPPEFFLKLRHLAFHSFFFHEKEKKSRKIARVDPSLESSDPLQTSSQLGQKTLHLTPSFGSSWLFQAWSMFFSWIESVEDDYGKKAKATYEESLKTRRSPSCSLSELQIDE
ncbi:MAG: hypothetical protein ACO3A2_06475 [Bdellovibrionia bacterium]